MVTKNKLLATLAWFLLLVTIVPAFASIIGALPYTLTNGSTADATQVMANYNKIITDTNANAAKNGVNSDITALTALSTPITAAQGGTTWYVGGTSTGSANAQITASVTPTGMTLASGQGVCFNAGFTNTGATTLVANGLTAKNVSRQSPSGAQALTGGEVVASSYTCAQYDGTEYILQTDGYASPGTGPLTNLASGTTTDLGTVASHNVNVTGTTTITALGSTASTTFPEYQLTFAGALTLTNNASSLILPGGANITTVANDTATAVYLGSGNWRVKNYNHIAPAPQTGQLQGVQYFVATGTWTRPAGVNSVLFICAGGGGAGGGSAAPGASQASEGGGGGAGGWAQKYQTAPAATYAITVPAAAAGVSGTTGSNGGNVTVGAILTCNGGTGGSTSAASNPQTAVTGGVGGTATSGDINITGEGGSFGFNVAAAAAAISGKGGSTPIGMGAPGLTVLTATATVGVAATQCGGGGGGSASNGNAVGAQTGGAGAAGCVIAYAYY